MTRQMFLVWNPEGRNPRYIHDTEASALAEARRLAKETMQKFYVLKAISQVQVRDPVEVIDLSQPSNAVVVDDDGIPF